MDEIVNIQSGWTDHGLRRAALKYRTNKWHGTTGRNITALTN